MEELSFKSISQKPFSKNNFDVEVLNYQKLNLGEFLAY
jgi:hypothetical protein